VDGVAAGGPAPMATQSQKRAGSGGPQWPATPLSARGPLLATISPLTRFRGVFVLTTCRQVTK
jgi:hypothetical protein